MQQVMSELGEFFVNELRPRIEDLPDYLSQKVNSRGGGLYLFQGIRVINSDEKFFCECRCHEVRGFPCIHILAVLAHLKMIREGQLLDFDDIRPYYQFKSLQAIVKSEEESNLTLQHSKFNLSEILTGTFGDKQERLNQLRTIPTPNVIAKDFPEPAKRLDVKLCHSKRGILLALINDLIKKDRYSIDRSVVEL